MLTTGFNPRARAGRDARTVTYSTVHESFNPRARAGRDVHPPRDRHGADCFNPRARAGRDFADHAAYVLADVVSIHAPVRGATELAQAQEGVAACFNPRARAGRDVRDAEADPHYDRFQSTRPCGARRGVHEAMTRVYKVFQSTRPCGARRDGRLDRQRRQPVSIHAPVRGATQLPGPGQERDRVSIHAPVRGATRTWTTGDLLGLSFNPRARAGRDSRASVVNRKHVDVSIHAPVRGATPLFRHGRALRFACFNPRARAGRDRGRSARSCS